MRATEEVRGLCFLLISIQLHYLPRITPHEVGGGVMDGKDQSLGMGRPSTLSDRLYAVVSSLYWVSWHDKLIAEVDADWRGLEFLAQTGTFSVTFFTKYSVLVHSPALFTLR